MTASEVLRELSVYVVRCGLLLLIGLSLPRLLRLVHPRALLLYWRALLPVVALVPLLDLPPSLRPTSGGLPFFVFSPEALVVTAQGAGLRGSAPPSTLGLLLAAGALVAFARVALGLLGIARLARRSRPLAAPVRFLPALEARLRASAALRVCRDTASPSTFGWRRPVVLLPEVFEEMPEQQQEAILCHELLHVRRKDWLATLLEEGLRAALWFHPAVGVLLARAALAREQVVDQDVVRLLGSRRPYLEALLRIASLRARPCPLPVPALCRGSQLSARLALLDREVSMNRTRLVSSFAAATLALGTTGVLGAAAVSSGEPPTKGAPPKASAPASDDASAPVRLSDLKAKGKLVEPKLISRVNPVYPEEARKAGLAGRVIVEAELTAKGTVRNPRVVESTDPSFDAPTLEAVSRWTYSPATLDGKPVAVLFTITTQYRLQ